MDPLTHVRRTAAALREAALADAPSASAADVVAAALVRVGASWRRSSSPEDADALGTADAVVLPGRAILVSGAATGREALVLVAHEVCHLVLHGAGGARRGADAAGWEPHPGGLRLRGYSTRQAKEVEADLFADELLCPSAWVRGRLAAGLSPTEVADEVGVPVGLALRQSTRALLRPHAEAEPRPVRPVEGLDSEQKRCAAWSRGPLLVRGGPGTGKTTTLLARARRAVERGEPASVLVLAATRAAAEEARVALWAACGSRRGAPVAEGAWVGTVADLALEVVSRWPGEVGLPERFHLADRVDALRVLDGAARSVGMAPPAGRGRLRLLRAVDDERHARAAAPARPAPTPLAEAYEAALRARGWIDAGGLAPGALLVLRSDLAVREAYRSRFRHVLVDDVQDLTPAEVRLLAEMHPITGDVWATTDPGQAIDGFRGRSGDPTAAFLSRFAPDEVRLRANHRAGARVAAPLASAFGRDAAPSRGRAGTLVVTGVGDAAGEAVAVVEAVRRHCGPDGAGGGQAVLARRHADLARIARALGLAGIPTLHAGDLSAREEVGDALAFARFALEGEGDAFERVAASAGYGVGARAVRLVRSLAGRVGGDVRDVVGDLRGLRGVGDGERVALADLSLHASKVVRGRFSEALTSWLFSPRGPVGLRLGAATSPADEATLVGLHRFAKVCEEAEASGAVDYPSLLERVRTVGSVDQHTSFGSVSVERSGLDAVRLMTVHAARGMEFDTVHLAAFDALARLGSPRSPPPRHDDGNVFRVALSRARDNLHVVVPEAMARRGEARLWGLMGARSTPAA